MKKITLAFLLLIIVNCKAQNPIINLNEWYGIVVPNSYLFDSEHDMEPFVGEYEFSQNGKYFRIKLIKTLQSYNGIYYRDMIIGEIEYAVGVNELVNTMGQLNIIYPNQFNHSIAGYTILENNDIPSCAECLPNEKRMKLKINDTHVSGTILVRRITVSGNPAIKIFKRSEPQYPPIRHGETAIAPVIPDGWYTLLKIN